MQGIAELPRLQVAGYQSCAQSFGRAGDGASTVGKDNRQRIPSSKTRSSSSMLQIVGVIGS
jgi:hypothetical protein